MLMQYFLPILLIFTIYSCKCQDLEKFVAPILDNQKAPLVAIVDTTNISAHIVRSIEIPLRNIINTTISCKLNEELKKDIVSGQVLSDVKVQLETLLQKIDKHIVENGIQITDVKQDIASLQMDTEETIAHEILEQKEDMTKLVDTLKSDQESKIKNLTSNVVLMQSEVQKKVEEHIGDSRDEFVVVKQVIATLRKEMEGKILENMKYFAKIVNTVNKDLDEKNEECNQQCGNHTIRIKGNHTVC
ncbi:Hypothetical predicted protein [Mytilus galloprovincialis]|uniref:Uncharacterized protein n=1 Tax=Mytilus galloprovincialis TaxID=29158 RepID=A0A8B6G9P2_MYTGA|nr:Hypothetical predicted protein [Mytilus galloprovincialis]